MVVRTLTIVGTGLIGGSVGLAALSRGYADEVVGYDRRASAARAALDRGAVTEVAASLAAAVERAEIVLLATPVDEMPRQFRRLQRLASAQTVVTDAGSTKAAVVRHGQASLGARFIGGHPMAGSERHGIEAAHETLFDDAWWVLTPTDETSANAYAMARDLARCVGAKPVAVGPEVHDALMARLSHVPQLTASALVEVAAASADRDTLLGLAAGGFRDVTRIAASDPRLWVPIIRSNRDAILSTLADLQSRLSSVAALIAGDRWEELLAFLAAGRRDRLDLFAKPSYAGDPITLAMTVPDRPGVLAEVTTAAGEIGANIEDLRIVHSTEGGRGRLELVVSGKPAAETLVAALLRRGYRAERVQVD